MDNIQNVLLLCVGLSAAFFFIGGMTAKRGIEADAKRVAKTPPPIVIPQIRFRDGCAIEFNPNHAQPWCVTNVATAFRDCYCNFFNTESDADAFIDEWVRITGRKP